jgi:capsular polysaccharide biosynthesis protein
VDNDGGADGQGVLLALVRRWKWIAAGAILGVFLAGVLVLVLPQRYTATGDVLLHGVDGDNAAQVSRMQTESELAHSIPVAQRALEELGTTGDPDELLELYHASPLTNELLRIEARAPTPELAVQRVTAIATAYLDYLADEGSQELESVEQTVETRIAALQAQIAQLDGQIAGFGVPGEDLTPEQQLLLTQRETLADELTTTQATLDQARSDHRLALERNKLVAAPVLPKRASSPRPRELAVVGFMIGAIVAMGVVIARDVLSRRLIRREGLAQAAGVSVITSPTLRVHRWPGRRGRAERLARLVSAPTTELAAATTAIAAALDARRETGRRRLVVVSMAAEHEAMAIVLRLAMDLAGRMPPASQRREGRTRQRTPGSGPQALRAPGVLVVDATAGQQPMIGAVLRAVRGGAGQPNDAELEAARAFRVIRTSDSTLDWRAVGINADNVDTPDLLITFAGDWRTAAATAHQLRNLEPDTSLIIARCGHVTAGNVQESAAALRRAGAAPLGIVVVDPDRFDSSTGQLHTGEEGDEWWPAEEATSPRETERGAVRRL